MNQCEECDVTTEEPACPKCGDAQHVVPLVKYEIDFTMTYFGSIEIVAANREEAEDVVTDKSTEELLAECCDDPNFEIVCIAPDD